MHLIHHLSPPIYQRRQASALTTHQDPTNFLGLISIHITSVDALALFSHLSTRHALASRARHGNVCSWPPPRGLRRRLRPRRPRRAHPHLPFRLRRRRLRHGNREAVRRRGGHGGGSDGGGTGAHAGGGRHGVRGAARLRRPHQPGRDAGPRRHGPHHAVPLRALRGRAAARLRARLPPPRLPHRHRRRRARARARSRAGRRRRRAPGRALGGCAHLLAALRRLRHHRRPAPHRRGHGTAAGGAGRRRQRARRRALLRRVHEPCALLRPSARGWGMGRPLGLLGRAAYRWAARWAGL